MHWGVSAELVGLAYIGDRNHFLIADQGSPPSNARRAEEVSRLLFSRESPRSTVRPHGLLACIGVTSK